MAVRAKFRLNSYTTEMHTMGYERKPGTDEPDYSKPIKAEKRTLNMTPVTSGSEEDKAFWNASPSGSIQLGVVNQEAWKHFELERTYYVDFTPAD